jgi:hypothetical protein
VSPILVRPVREQLEHDRIIRLLQPRYRRRFTVGINPGMEQSAPVGTGADTLYPDLVLTDSGRGHKVACVVEVETGESVNTLEAIAQWVRYGRLPIDFALYVPANVVELSKRLCADHHVGVTEIWTYHTVGDQIRFTQVFRAPLEGKLAAARAAAAEARRAAAKPAGAAKPKPRKAAKPAPARKAVPVKKAAPKASATKKPAARAAVAKKSARKSR